VYYTTELLLGRYARRLLMKQQIGTLLRFSRMVRHDLRPWLRREKTRSARIENIDEMSTAISSTLKQFEVDIPSQWERDSSDSNSKTDEFVRRSHDGLAMKHISAEVERENERTAREDLLFLLEELKGSECDDWSLVVATALFDLNTAASILKKNPTVVPLYMTALQMQPR
jgi:hypothetical protein